MITASLQVRRAVEWDHDRIASLIYYESNSHRHLDWHSPLEWIGSPYYWVREEGGNITAALACPEDPPHVAWIRFFGYYQYLSSTQAWTPLWDAAREEMELANQPTYVSAIVVKQWFQSLLVSSGFELKQNIVLLELKREDVRVFPAPHGIHIRPMMDEDLPIVARVDLKAFGQFWHNTEKVLQRARLQCASATVAEDDSGVIGYQLSTKNPFGAHLARLGVLPEAQGKGVGLALVNQLIETLNVSQFNKLSVNTQEDNIASLSLYKKMGFIRTGEQFPVFVYSINT
ncbi:Acetyltransferase YpeA [Anaerolineales bacterium]|nr:Acetyltransferase YpeA [Anaerolineales bacterium]